jgi:predicted  nucleic acid-binding Zn-ribbon protein
MTFVGKILVIVLMVFSILFLALSAVVFTTTANWREQTEEQKKKAGELQRELTDAKAAIDNRTKDLADAQAAHKAQVAQLEAQKADLATQATTLQREIADARTKLEVALKNMQAAQQEAEVRANESTQLRELLAAVQKQANEFKERQRELKDEIYELRRYNEDAARKNDDLRKRVAGLVQLLRSHNIEANTATTSTPGREAPPASLRGTVTAVSADNTIAEINLGSDEGLLVGHRLKIYHTQPRPEYLGELEVLTVESDRSAGRITSHVLGKKVKEGDRVAPQVQPRG